VADDDDTTPPAIAYCFTNLTLSTTSSNCQALLPDLTGTKTPVLCSFYTGLDAVVEKVKSLCKGMLIAIFT